MHNETTILSLGLSTPDTYIDEAGNRLTRRCPHCGGLVIPFLDVTGTMIAGRCALCLLSKAH